MKKSVNRKHMVKARKWLDAELETTAQAVFQAMFASGQIGINCNVNDIKVAARASYNAAEEMWAARDEKIYELADEMS